MQRERKRNGILRRLVLGLAVAAVVAPAAQAHPDSGTVAPGNAAEPPAVINGDDKTFAPETDGYAGLINGDDKTFAPETDGYAGHINGDDKVIVPKPVHYTVAGYPLERQIRDAQQTTAPVEAVRVPSSFDWGDALVGAGAAFGLMLLLGGAVLGTRHVRPTAA
jgi:hypothetical protein